MSRFLSVEVSDEFDSIRHLVRLQDFPDELQHANDLAHGSVLLEAIDNTKMSGSLVVQSQEIGVVGEDDATLGHGEGQMVSIIRAEQSRVGSCRHSDAATAQAIGHSRVDVFIKMELDCPGHSSLPACP